MRFSGKIASLLILLIALCGFSIKTSAGPLRDSTIVQKFQISYPVNDTELHEGYQDNLTALRIIREYFQKTPHIDSIIIYSYSSPEGPLSLNRRLAEERGKRARRYLLDHKAAPLQTAQIRPSKAPVWDGPVQTEEIKTVLALKTNLLYDALSFANFSIEAPLYEDKVSLLYYHQFPWWTWGQADNEFCSRFLSIGAETRWWFKTKDRFNGHFLGAYAESGKYDFEYKRLICYQGEFFSTGLTYGYAMPIGRHFNLEFSISAGFASIPYRGYTPSEDYEILWKDQDKVGRVQYIGPTKAQISLVVPIRVKTKGGNAR